MVLLKKINIIVPCYNEEKALPFFYQEITKVIEKLDDVKTEILFIDDGSTDQTLNYIKNLSEKDNKVKYISFSRNFGKEAALLAGLEKSDGDYVTLMDADLQDPPELLLEMWDLIKDGEYDSIGTRRINRKGEPIIRSFCANCFYKLINKMSKVEMISGARDFRIMNRQMVDSIISLKEYNRYSKGLFSFVGFKTKWLEYKNVERVAGETKWSFFKLFKYAIEGIVSFTTIPLVISTFLGLLFFIISFIFVIVIFVKTLIFGDPVSGWPSLACIILFCAGIQLFSLGIIGEYLAKTYLETKNRPVYI